MTPEEIQGDYQCVVSVEDYRVAKKAEYKIVIRISFYSSRMHSTGSTSWHIWRSFNAFRKLDEQLRKRNPTHMKGIKFPPLYRRKTFFRTNFSSNFLENRMRELDTYMTMIIRSPQVVAFHVMSIQSQSLKAFVGFTNGFGSNGNYEAQDAVLRPCMSILAPGAVSEDAVTASVLGDDDDDFRSVASFSTVSSITSFTSGSDYRWSGTGFVGSSNFARNSIHTGNNSSFVGANSSRGSSFYPASIRESHTEGNQMSTSISRGSLMAVTAPDIITPEIDMQRAKMEDQLLRMDLMGVGMPPDGSCLLHCIVYEMFPLQCLKDYPSMMTVVNVGAADGMAPRRVAAAQFLRVRLMEYGVNHVEKLATFLMQDPNDLQQRYEHFRDTSDEQATIAELYAAASMFNIELVLITNDESFKIDPVMPIVGLPSVREGPLRTVTLGYLIPADGLAGHYICTRERRSPYGGPSNSFTGGSYRGSINIGPPKNMRCSSVGRRFDRIPEQRVE